MRGLLILLLAFSIPALGQYEVDSIGMPQRLNTIGTNLSPFVIVTMNSYPFSPRFSVNYKRQVDINKKWRFGGNYEIRDRFEESLSEGHVIGYSDTTLTYLLDHRDYYSFDARIGMEWFKPRPHSMVYGVDLIVGMVNETDGFRIIPRYFDGIGMIPSPFEPEEFYEQTITYGAVGFDFSVGQKLAVNEQFNFLIQWTPQFTYRFPIAEQYSDPALRDESPGGDVEMKLRGIEIYLHYLF